MSKPEVRINNWSIQRLGPGYRFLMGVPENHPDTTRVSNQSVIQSSQIVAVSLKNSTVETLNTIYLLQGKGASKKELEELMDELMREPSKEKVLEATS